MTFEEAVSYALEDEADADKLASGNSENVSSKQLSE
jgi:hypothetical protein